jgi:hypothetical protein
MAMLPGSLPGAVTKELFYFIIGSYNTASISHFFHLLGMAFSMCLCEMGILVI